MNKIKTRIGIALAGIIAISTPLFIAFIATAPVAFTGCAVFQNHGTNNIEQVNATAMILQNAARSGAVAAINPPTGNTNNAVYFKLASEALSTFITGKDYSPGAFQNALLAIKIPQANNVWVQLGIGAVIDLYTVYFQQYVQGQVNGNYAAQAFLVAIQNGFSQAVGGQLAPMPPAPTPLQLRATTAPSILPRRVK